jgi:hypothetical protein
VTKRAKAMAANGKSVRQMMKAATKRARAARAMASAMRVACNKEGKGGGGKSNGNEGGEQATVTRAMEMVTGMMWAAMGGGTNNNQL